MGSYNTLIGLDLPVGGPTCVSQLVSAAHRLTVCQLTSRVGCKSLLLGLDVSLLLLKYTSYIV